MPPPGNNPSEPPAKMSNPSQDPNIAEGVPYMPPVQPPQEQIHAAYVQPPSDPNNPGGAAPGGEGGNNIDDLEARLRALEGL
jgi:hypothetical protein